MSDITVVISNYNYRRYVGSAIESCLRQTAPCKIIVVDDHSTDQSWEVIKQYRTRVKGVRLNCNSGGNARGKNVGICLADTEYVVCLDSDDILLPNSLRLRLDNIKDCDWVHGKAIRMTTTKAYEFIIQSLRSQEAHQAWTRYDKYARRGIPETDVSWFMCVEASTVMARRKLYEEVGLYDENLKWKIDREMWHRFLNNGKRKKFIDQFVSVYRLHNKQVTRDRSRKDPKFVNDQFNRLIELRKNGVNSKNTSMLQDYNYQKWIADVVGE